ncbi:hypothetical protein SM124_07530 [Bacillus sp. 31A1R]|uniref:Uncharacterized protein n=1 Tax=Robertmurraya mangrovi TaxID=3098077 RepID=A0ABU5IWT4_9BACI|nr:hypothetical protein [Bacillus sp. 31A1R]MDZ5471597.1 hypothetical protein [Bacillus sp. 31A1R]
MGRIFNISSFYLSIICFLLIMLVSTTSIKTRIIKWFDIHPLEILFYTSIGIFVSGLIGFTGVNNWASVLRGIFTLGFSLTTVVFLAYIIFV